MLRNRERTSDPADIGRHRAQLRLRRGLTQCHVAAELVISRRYVCEIDAGKPSLYSKRLFRLLDLLDTELAIEGKDVA